MGRLASFSIGSTISQRKFQKGFSAILFLIYPQTLHYAVGAHSLGYAWYFLLYGTKLDLQDLDLSKVQLSPFNLACCHCLYNETRTISD